MGSGTLSCLAAHHRDVDPGCIDVWGDVQAEDVCSRHLHAETLTLLGVHKAGLLFMAPSCIACQKMVP